MIIASHGHGVPSAAGNSGHTQLPALLGWCRERSRAGQRSGALPTMATLPGSLRDQEAHAVPSCRVGAKSDMAGHKAGGWRDRGAVKLGLCE